MRWVFRFGIAESKKSMIEWTLKLSEITWVLQSKTTSRLFLESRCLTNACNASTINGNSSIALKTLKILKNTALIISTSLSSSRTTRISWPRKIVRTGFSTEKIQALKRVSLRLNQTFTTKATISSDSTMRLKRKKSENSWRRLRTLNSS